MGVAGHHINLGSIVRILCNIYVKLNVSVYSPVVCMYILSFTQDACMLHSFTLRQQLQTARQGMSSQPPASSTT